jgi:hypothetical protein
LRGEAGVSVFGVTLHLKLLSVGVVTRPRDRNPRASPFPASALAEFGLTSFRVR